MVAMSLPKRVLPFLLALGVGLGVFHFALRYVPPIFISASGNSATEVLHRDNSDFCVERRMIYAGQMYKDKTESIPEPEYPLEAQVHKTTGTVKLQAFISASGDVENIVVREPLPDGLTDSAIAATRKVKMHFSDRHGEPLAQWITLFYTFKVDSEKSNFFH
jgi:TonB family protein